MAGTVFQVSGPPVNSMGRRAEHLSPVNSMGRRAERFVASQ